MKKEGEWHVGACEKGERKFLQLLFGEVVVKELPFQIDSDIEGVAAILEKTAHYMNLLHINPTTFEELRKKQDTIFPPVEAEQQELEIAV